MDVIKKEERNVPIQRCTTTGCAQMQTSFAAREQMTVSPLLQQHMWHHLFDCEHFPQLIISGPRQAQMSCQLEETQNMHKWVK